MELGEKCSRSSVITCKRGNVGSDLSSLLEVIFLTKVVTLDDRDYDQHTASQQVRTVHFYNSYKTRLHSFIAFK